MDEVQLADAASTEHWGARLARCMPSDAVVYLHGDLGAGKTTLVRGWLHALGHQGRVRSPSYSLMEVYDLPGRRVLHMDLYRLQDPAELMYIGLADGLDAHTQLLIEWPERGQGRLPPATLQLHLAHATHGRILRLAGRDVGLLDVNPPAGRPQNLG